MVTPASTFNIRGRPGLNFTLETDSEDDCEPAFAMNTKSNTKYIIPQYQKTRNSYEGDLSHLSTFQHSEENVAALSGMLTPIPHAHQ